MRIPNEQLYRWIQEAQDAHDDPKKPYPRKVIILCEKLLELRSAIRNLRDSY